MCLAIEGSETIKKDCTIRSNHQTIIQRRSNLPLSFQLIFKCTAEEKKVYLHENEQTLGPKVKRKIPP